MLTTGYNFYTYISTNNVSTTWFISYAKDELLYNIVFILCRSSKISISNFGTKLNWITFFNVTLHRPLKLTGWKLFLPAKTLTTGNYISNYSSFMIIIYKFWSRLENGSEINDLRGKDCSSGAVCNLAYSRPNTLAPIRSIYCISNTSTSCC